MHLCIFNHRLTRHSDVLNDLVLRLSAQPYSQLVGEVVPLTVSLHPPSGAAGICLLGLFCFNRFITNPLDLWRKFEDSTPLLRVPLSDLFCPTFFRRQFRSCRRFFSHWNFPHEMLRFSFYLIFSVVSTIVFGLVFSSSLIWRVSLGSCLSQKVPCFLGAPKFLRD